MSLKPSYPPHSLHSTTPGRCFSLFANESWSAGESSNEQTGTRVGAGYKFGPAKVGFVYEVGTVGVDGGKCSKQL